MVIQPPPPQRPAVNDNNERMLGDREDVVASAADENDSLNYLPSDNGTESDEVDVEVVEAIGPVGGEEEEGR